MRILTSLLLLCGLFACNKSPEPAPAALPSLPGFDTAAIIAEADEMLSEEVVTVTDFVAERSEGGIHDYYSEGLYWWPDPENPDGPYIRRDGEPNPDNFYGHNSALKRLGQLVTTLTVAYELTGDKKYAHRALDHLRAWFANEDTRMNPSLLYGQAIKGRVTGRGIGIIDTLRLIQAALSVQVLSADGVLAGADLTAIRQWFGDYGDWLTTHKYGTDERDNGNNHSTWWGAQLAAFARAADRPDLTAQAEELFVRQLPIQVAVDGSLPHEFKRTKPYHYLNYTLQGWAILATLLSDDERDFWNEKFTATLPPYDAEAKEAGADAGAGEMGEAVELSLADVMKSTLPYLEDPTSWPYKTRLEPVTKPHADDYLWLTARGLDDERFLQYWEKYQGTYHEEYTNHANLVLWHLIDNDVD